uniref:Uncharacterized protein n=1 Tax=Craspedostauros australis TaxID=1486917 RepID=A0A7R9WR52_9STRA|mmetsp:Transcript_16945/g.46893  ORF Transcript_16945/g.46893 Transcript_16945/m.46893 type:complete len:198 (+) Transcript_16945:153-746(+)|eukprot:CAMPEP_0198118106 /NCGR_PEP_ID=MMETSP1442-20131203/20391_1 /TAXON_ID= /ORGANISM="Craspedostauros australis, Strain CCMP3328" /LENGTH=197 /DNA_ID=CAMNT_0043776305 /DNA_START=68 /DNA_END=661 /DNA_ORIENTATION=-
MKGFATFLVTLMMSSTLTFGFAPQQHSVAPSTNFARRSTDAAVTATQLQAAVPDLEVVALVAGQENYGLAIVCLGEGVWSLSQAPSLDHALKTLGPAVVAAIVLGVVSGPMITSGDLDSVGLGLWIATATSVGLGGSYIARLLAPYSPSSKEIAALGLLVAIAGFFSFTQNLVVDGFVTLPSIPMPSLPSIDIQLPF